MTVIGYQLSVVGLKLIGFQLSVFKITGNRKLINQNLRTENREPITENFVRY